MGGEHVVCKKFEFGSIVYASDVSSWLDIATGGTSCPWLSSRCQTCRLEPEKKKEGGGKQHGTFENENGHVKYNSSIVLERVMGAERNFLTVRRPR
jgi:hypothetical protein